METATTTDPVLSAFDQMEPSEALLDCGCRAWAPKSLACQQCEDYRLHVQARMARL